MKAKEYKIDFNGRPLVAEFSDWAEQANGSVTVKYGETIVFATAIMSERTRDELDYFPLTVDYEEKFYAAGKILGSRFMRREGRPSEEATLNGRMIDRTLRPLFDHKIRNDVQVIATVLSIDEENDPDVTAILAASLALSTSSIPWNGPVAAVRIGKNGESFIINPTFKEKTTSDLDMIICGKNEKINMIEGKAKQVPDETIAKAFEHAIPEIEKLINFQNDIIKDIGKEKVWPAVQKAPDGMGTLFKKEITADLEKILSDDKIDKNHRHSMLGDLKSHWMKIYTEAYADFSKNPADDLFEETINQIIHTNVLKKEKRPDGRKIDEIRTLFTRAGILPRAHGSGLFYRGQTHVLSVATLGAPGDSLLIEGMEIQEKRRFIHHYNFPPFCTGETGRSGNPGRREIGHGALAGKALEAVIPSVEEFPYTIRIVSETMSSNGSSSMGSVCASTLALMDAGVPIKAPVSGIAMGLMMSLPDSGENTYKVLTDIQGPEDHHGDTDFKAAGTKNGVTAIQMDVKVEGLTVKMLHDLLTQSKKARLEILDKILEALPESRKNLSPFAPQIIVVKIKPEKIGGVIGSGGKTINQIREETGTEIDIEEDGTVFITGATPAGAQKAKEIIEEITYEPTIGESMKGPVSRVFEFGAMVEIKPGMEGLIHISELAPFRVNKVTDVVQLGDIVPVKVVGIDEQGRINLSLKQEDPNYARRKQNPGGKTDSR